ncbi:Ulp1 peptidase [Malassezia sp. CBS 17886]|nr:Ulp1 peptidase [Malassezia sp. CBS 17886]
MHRLLAQRKEDPPTPGTPHRSQFRPDFSRLRAAPPAKKRFRVGGQPHEKRLGFFAAVPQQSATQRPARKAPLGLEEFKAGIRARQSARIAAMVRDTYRMMAQKRGGRLGPSDFEALVSKRVRVQRLLDLETLQWTPRAQTKLDDAAYTQQTLETLQWREARAGARLPPRALAPEAALQKLRAARDARRAQHGILGRPPLPARLCGAEEQLVRASFQRHGVLSKIPGAQVDAHDFAKLQPGQWLNDEVINFYGTLIMRRADAAAAAREQAAAKGTPARPADCALWSVHFFSSFFWPTLSTRGHAGVRRWSRRVDLFTKDLILFPINLGQTHWVCAAINLRLRRFEYYDSMGIARPAVFAALRAYLADELRDKKGLELDARDWIDFAAGDASPQQENGYDCGVFAVQTLEQLSRRDPRVPPEPPLHAAEFTHPVQPEVLGRLREEHAGDYAWNFAQRDMAYLRRRMALEIVAQRLLEE